MCLCEIDWVAIATVAGPTIAVLVAAYLARQTLWHRDRRRAYQDFIGAVREWDRIEYVTDDVNRTSKAAVAANSAVAGVELVAPPATRQLAVNLIRRRVSRDERRLTSAEVGALRDELLAFVAVARADLGIPGPHSVEVGPLDDTEF